MNRRIIPTIEALENSTPPLPHNDPLLMIASHGGGSWGFGTTPIADSPETYIALLQPAMRFAQRLLVHPHIIAKAVAIISETPKPHPVVEKAFRWAISLSEYTSLEAVAWFVRPQQSDLADVYTLEELTIMLHKGNVERLRRSKEKVDDEPGVSGRHLLSTAIAMIHALVPAARTQVYCLLRGSPTFHIPYSPALVPLLATSNASFELDIHLLRGCHGGWLALRSGGGGKAFVDSLKDKDIDFLVVLQTGAADGVFIKKVIDSAWIAEAVEATVEVFSFQLTPEAFEHDQIHLLQLPAKLLPDPIVDRNIAVMDRRREAGEHAARGLAVPLEPQFANALTCQYVPGNARPLHQRPHPTSHPPPTPRPSPFPFSPLAPTAISSRPSSPIMDMNKRVTVTLEELENQEPLPPHPDPLGAVMHASAPLYDDPIVVDNEGPLLLLHPSSIGKLATIIAATGEPRPLIETAIRRVLGTTQWVVAIDNLQMLPSLAVHVRPPKDDLADIFTLPELTIFVNSTQVERLRIARDIMEKEDKREAWDLHLFLTAVAMAHALVPAIRTQVFCILKSSPDSQIPYPRSPTGRERDIGWYWESMVLGGILEGAWRCTPTVIGLPTSNRAPSDPRIPKFDFVALQAAGTMRVPVAQYDVFEFLLLQRRNAKGEPTVKWELDETWVAETVEAFEHGQLDRISLPPKIDGKPLDDRYFTILDRRNTTAEAEMRSAHRVPSLPKKSVTKRRKATDQPTAEAGPSEKKKAAVVKLSSHISIRAESRGTGELDCLRSACFTFLRDLPETGPLDHSPYCSRASRRTIELELYSNTPFWTIPHPRRLLPQPSPSTMANKRKFVCREELDSETAPLPHPDPLGSVMHAKAFLSQTITVETDRPVDPAHVDLITRAMRFAQLLLLHPDSIGKLASIYANKPGPQPLIEKAIRRVLGTTQWAVGLDSYVVLACLASHSRPAREDLSEVYTLAELTIFLNPTQVSRLEKARIKMDDDDDREEWDAHLFLTAVALAHAMVPAIRTQVYCILQCAPDEQIKFPKLSCYAYEHDAGWYWESQVFGGILEGAWRSSLPQPVIVKSSHPSTDSRVPTFDFASLQAGLARNPLNQREKFEFLLLRRDEAEGVPAAKMELRKDWLAEAGEAFENGELDKLSLSPKFLEPPLEEGRFTILDRRGARGERQLDSMVKDGQAPSKKGSGNFKRKIEELAGGLFKKGKTAAMAEGGT
ncbi:uncharacterized protein MKK02DRAFT_30432 [Dioszegia hungarica]|uniref:Uncharacterized protein n=1 Tax=Dioszegia hungarica TaxID=4972 RepID=A0AA38H4V9_9TREE|nr:uncharacterized protein MKK02DRAFT_30432 [Dioszegia hungarica]KAI9632679.1 hypothetical protein MKK02DRAFT_30432 [Dioszegia hungarica]